MYSQDFIAVFGASVTSLIARPKKKHMKMSFTKKCRLT